MISQDIFIEEAKGNPSSHSLHRLAHLHPNPTPQQIQKYFTDRAATTLLVRQMAASQILKIEKSLCSAKVKAIFKERMKKSWRRGEEGIEKKISSRTNVCDEDQQEVSQYLSIWDEGEPDVDSSH